MVVPTCLCGCDHIMTTSCFLMRITRLRSIVRIDGEYVEGLPTVERIQILNGELLQAFVGGSERLE